MLNSTKIYQIAQKLYRRLSSRAIRGLHNQISVGNSKITFDLVGNHNRIDIHPSASVNCKIYLRGNHHHIYIGKNVRIKSGLLWLEDTHGKISIGDHTTIERATLAVTEPNRSISIGEHCMLSTGVEIRTGDSHSILSCDTNERINFAKDVHVANNVWIGSEVSVLKGSTIGEFAIIATRSVVTGPVAAYCLAGGIPAKILKTQVKWTRERIN